MKILASLALAAACVIASPAFAGPQGTGLTFTEEVAKKALQKKKQAEAALTAGQAAKADKDAKSAPETRRAS
jgi:hypothetical protein